MSTDIPIQLWTASENGAAEEAIRLLADAEARGEAAMVDLVHGRIYWGWHPVIGRFKVGRRADDAPGYLPTYLARLEDADHVHAGGDTAEEAVAELLALFAEVASRLEPSE